MIMLEATQGQSEEFEREESTPVTDGSRTMSNRKIYIKGNSVQLKKNRVNCLSVMKTLLA